jgi:hypothetical protein
MYSFFKMFEKIYPHYVDGSVAKEVWVHNRADGAVAGRDWIGGQRLTADWK